MIIAACFVSELGCTGDMPAPGSISAPPDLVKEQQKQKMITIPKKKERNYVPRR
jgi:hypothetical protein